MTPSWTRSVDRTTRKRSNEKTQELNLVSILSPSSPPKIYFLHSFTLWSWLGTDRLNSWGWFLRKKFLGHFLAPIYFFCFFIHFLCRFSVCKLFVLPDSIEQFLFLKKFLPLHTPQPPSAGPPPAPSDINWPNGRSLSVSKDILVYK